MKRILHVVDSMGQGGIQAFIMNVYLCLDTDKYQFDFLLHRKLDGYYEHLIKERGGRVYYVPSRNKGIIRNYFALHWFFVKHREYEIVHMHESSLAYLTPLVAAKHLGVKTRIIHSHSSRVSGNRLNVLLHYFNKRRIRYIANTYLACGDLAAKWFYNHSNIRDEPIIVRNGIDLNSFSYDEVIRSEVRNELHISDDTFILGHVGRFNSVKNHSFLIDVFYDLLLLEPNCCLLLLGDGALQDQIKKKVHNLGIEGKVIFAGVRKDAYRYYQAMDCLVLPSLYEGFPVTAVEAQAAGLPCFLSDTITKEVIINPNVKQLRLDDTPQKWAEEILRGTYRINDISSLLDKGLDINSTVEQLLNIYDGIC